MEKNSNTEISYFRNCIVNTPDKNISIKEFIESIQSGTYKKEILKYRKLLNENGKDNELVKTFKKVSIPAITYTGIFSKRASEGMLIASGILIVDVDDWIDIESLKNTLKNDKYIYAMFVSPSSHGLKILFKAAFENNSENYKKLYFEIVQYLYDTYHIPTKDERISKEKGKPGIDLSCSDISRLCLASYDPDLYLNNNAEIFEVHNTIIKKQLKQPKQGSSKIKENKEKVLKIIEQIEIEQTDIANGYENWLNIGFALHDEFGADGRELFHRISQINENYNFNECEKQYDSIEKSNKEGITIKTFFKIAKEAGIDIRKSVLTSNKFILAKEFIEKHYLIRYNIIANEYECRPLDKTDYGLLNENNIFVKMQVSGLNISLNHLVALLKSDFVKRYNPFNEYFETLPVWNEETDYISELANFIITKDRERFNRNFKKWLVRVVACALIDSYFNKQAFILVHDRQNSGKSTFCRFLCPPILTNYIAENLSIDKDSRILLTRNLLINLDELSTLSKVEINALKSLFSKDKINDRLPYDRRNSIIPRRCSFIGSTNQTEFLNDESGSVRWLCFVIEEIDWSYKNKINIDNVYSQAYWLFCNDYDYNLTREEIKENEEYNKQFQVISAERELVSKYIFQGTKDNKDGFLTATDILMYITGRIDNKVKLNTSNIGKALKYCGIERVKHSTEKIYGYYIKFAK